MANPQKPWKAEYAKSGRSSCKACKDSIEKEALRLGKMVQSTHFDGLMPMWNHASCILKKAKQIKSVDDVDGLDMLRWEDQQRIRKHIEDGGSSQAGGGSSNAAKTTVNEFGVEVSQNARASCKKCGEKITKGEVRMSAKPEGKGTRGLAWHHATCFLDMFPSAEVDKLPGWDSLEKSEQETIHGLIDKKKGTAKEEQHDEENLQKLAPKAGEKRKADAHGDSEECLKTLPPSTESRSPPRTCSSKRTKKSSASVFRSALSGDLNKAFDIMRMAQNQASHERKLYQAVKNMEQVKRRGVTFQRKAILYLLDRKIDKIFVEFETDEEKWDWLKHLDSDAD